MVDFPPSLSDCGFGLAWQIWRRTFPPLLCAAYGFSSLRGSLALGGSAHWTTARWVQGIRASPLALESRLCSFPPRPAALPNTLNRLSSYTPAMPRRIFVQIASYRDRQLLPTIVDCLAQASRPHDLSFCIAWQHHPGDAWDGMGTYAQDKRFEILDIASPLSQGVCWARHHTQKYFAGEPYTLQIDSHMRFARGWDDDLVGMLDSLLGAGHPRPLLSAYPPAFFPDRTPVQRDSSPLKIDARGFSKAGILAVASAAIPNCENMTAPIPARFLGAGFLFTIGRFCQDVQYDPELYFNGEEISLAVRAFTKGYDLFHPHKVLLWHEYIRKGKPKHWDDDRDWSQREQRSLSRLAHLFGFTGREGHSLAPAYGLGAVRTLAEYESFAGIAFRRKAIDQYTLEGKCPPNRGIAVLRHCGLPANEHAFDVHIPFDKIAPTPFDSLAIMVDDQTCNTICRVDIPSPIIIEEKRRGESYFSRELRFRSNRRPRGWVIWHYSRSKGWSLRYGGRIGLD